MHCAWKYRSQGVTAAQMNLYYGLAVIAIDGVAFVDQYRQDRLADPRILDLISRIEAREEAGIDAMGPAFRHAAHVAVTTRDGRTLQVEMLDRRGSPECPLSAADVEHKFRCVVASCLAPADIESVIELVDRIDLAEDVAPLLDLLAAPRPQAC
jgi:2-methylcitrate dehydratase PrpD